MNVGDYVRTKHRNEYVIRKVINIIHDDFMEDNHIIFDKSTKYQYYVEDDKQYISSPNIIDLIEVGDYVNGLEVVKFDEKHNCFICECCGMECGEGWIYDDKNIKSIVTKEQFSQMEYKVGVSDEC